MYSLNYLNNWKKPKAAVYIRVSTVNQVEKGYGLEAQLSMCKKMCDIKNYEMSKVYTDGGISGTTKATDRPGFNKLLTDARNKEFEVVVFYAFDRLARDIRVFLSIVDNLKKFGIKIVSCKENIDTTTDNGEFMMNIYASVSHLELKTIKSRMAMGREQKRLESGYLGGPLPYGYSLVDSLIEINTYKAHIVNVIYKFYHIEKRNMKHIAKILTNNNIPTPRGGEKWSGKTIAIILDNKLKYEGCIINNNENDIRWKKILPTIYPDRK